MLLSVDDCETLLRVFMDFQESLLRDSVVIFCGNIAKRFMKHNLNQVGVAEPSGDRVAVAFEAGHTWRKSYTNCNAKHHRETEKL